MSSKNFSLQVDSFWAKKTWFRGQPGNICRFRGVQQGSNFFRGFETYGAKLGRCFWQLPLPWNFNFTVTKCFCSSLALVQAVVFVSQFVADYNRHKLKWLIGLSAHARAKNDIFSRESSDLHNPRHPADYLQGTSWKKTFCRHIWSKQREIRLFIKAGTFSYILGCQRHL